MRKPSLQGAEEGGGVRYSVGDGGLREALTASAGCGWLSRFEWGSAAGIGGGSEGIGGGVEEDGTGEWKDGADIPSSLRMPSW